MTALVITAQQKEVVWSVNLVGVQQQHAFQ
jgi:hypothetical protein